jgi:uncharacterized protein
MEMPAEWGALGSWCVREEPTRLPSPGIRAIACSLFPPLPVLRGRAGVGVLRGSRGTCGRPAPETPGEGEIGDGPVPLQLTTRADGVVLIVKVVPRSSRDRIAGEYAGGIKVNVSKPPEAGAANEAVIRVVAKVLGIAAVNLEIVRGHTSPRKEILIRGMDAQTIAARISTSLGVELIERRLFCRYNFAALIFSQKWWN